MQPDLGQLIKESREIANVRAENAARIKMLEEKNGELDLRQAEIDRQIEIAVKAASRQTRKSVSNQVSEELRSLDLIREAKIILSSKETFLTVRQIVEHIKKQNKIPDTPFNDRFVLNKVSNEMRSKALKKREFRRFKNEDGEYFYGLADWFSSEGEPNPLYDLLPF